MTPDLPSLPDLPATNYRLGIEGNGYGSDDRLLFESGYSDEDMRSYGRACYELGARSTAAQPAGFKLLKDTTYEERSWPEDAAHENGNYSCCCVICLRQFTGHKRRVVCKVCYAAPPAAAQPADAGPWSLTEAGSLQSADFTHDVQLGISGDFTNKDERLAYARGLCAKLNAAAAQPARLTIDELARTAYLVFCDAQDDSGWESLNDGERQSFTRVAEALNGTIAEMGSAAAQPVEPTVTPTEAVVGFASWVTCRPGTLPAGEGHDAAPWSEAVHEFVVAQGWPTVRDVFPHNLKRPPLSAPPAAAQPVEPMVSYSHVTGGARFQQRACDQLPPWAYDVRPEPPAASGDSTPPSAPVQGDPSGALRPEPEAVGQDRVRAWSEAPGAERVWTCKVGGPVAGIPNGGDSPMRAAVSQAFEQITGFEARFIFSGWGGELTEGERAVVENRPAMPTFEVRVAGPDDVFSYSDELFALRHANSVNQAYLADRAKHPDSEVLCVATVHAAEPPQAASGSRGD